MTEKQRLRLEKLQQQEALLQEIKEEKESLKEEQEPVLEQEIEEEIPNNDDEITIVEEEFEEEDEDEVYPVDPSDLIVSEFAKLTEEQKQTLKDEIVKLLTSDEISILYNSRVQPKKEKVKRFKQKMEFSKKVTIASVILAYLFIAFVCVEMHITQNLEPIGYVGTGIVIMLGICVRAYMKRAYQADLVNMKVNQSAQLSELKIKYGENFVYENINDVNLDG